MFESVDVIDRDVLIVGAGLAGLAAAIAADDAGAEVTVGAKVHPVRSHSGAAQGGINAAIKPNDDPRDHMFDTVKGSGYLADQNAVRVLASEAPEAVRMLWRMGAPFSRASDGTLAQRPFGGQRRDRTCYVADHTGHNLLHTLYGEAVRRGVEFWDEWYATRLVLDDGGALAGVTGFDIRRGGFMFVRAKALVIATGGAARVFGQSSNALINTGDGVALAYRAGLAIEDLEFFQIHPTGLLNGILMTEGCRGEGAYLVNASGERFMESYAPKFMELAPRDQVSRAIQTEINEGRGFPGDYVHLDLRHLGERKITERLPQIREIAINFAGVDPVAEPIPVRPTAHYTMGGIDTDVDGRTEAPGVFAAGECACVSVHGANRLGGNSLLETTVFGPRAGRAAAEHAASAGAPEPADASVEDERKRLAALLARTKGESVAKIKAEMEETMVSSFGIFKEGPAMVAGLDRLRGLAERHKRVAVADKGRVFNVTLVHALEVGCMLDVALISVAGSIRRAESRGGHYRRDFPKMDNDRFLCHSIARRAPEGEPELATKPVVIEDIEPEAEVKY